MPKKTNSKMTVEQATKAAELSYNILEKTQSPVAQAQAKTLLAKCMDILLEA